jgi:hypothetical protein
MLRARQDFGDAKIGEEAVAALVQQHVARLHVAMDDVVRVSVVKRVADLRDQAADLG